jgi:putative transposase
MSAPDRRALVDRAAGRPSVRRQCALLGLARSSGYRRPRPANDNELQLMRRLDELFTAWPPVRRQDGGGFRPGRSGC